MNPINVRTCPLRHRSGKVPEQAATWSWRSDVVEICLGALCSAVIWRYTSHNDHTYGQRGVSGTPSSNTLMVLLTILLVEPPRKPKGTQWKRRHFISFRRVDALVMSGVRLLCLVIHPSPAGEGSVPVVRLPSFCRWRWSRRICRRSECKSDAARIPSVGHFPRNGGQPFGPRSL